ncbi:uncharacterized protein LOC120206344 [Hibiscus syriacus]|uniref:uncharacterized protein LOC120206344 n=1 Tax=Hibiscus syriacus TaxID=106335 RepID=UPI00192399B7|nr:uncharacterized protein LOC120206344 [Hibiscus syriacus]
MLNYAAAKGIFSFHPKCKKIGLTHLTFADDLLIFCKGNLDSVMGVITVLNSFYELSGLKLNALKSEIFTVGISAHEIDNIISCSGFKLGVLPVRYLGIPLVTRKLSYKDCQPLIEKINSRLHQWQLILPQLIIKKIEQICSRFFWKGSDIPASGARVSWDRICSPKSEGGLGIKDIKSWNKVCTIILIKNLLAGEGSLWVAWTQNYIIKQQNFWTMDIPSNSSWTFKRIIKLRSVAHPIMFAGFKCTKSLWEDVRLNNNKVSWKKLIWYPMHIPKHSIITWMIILDRLPTKDRLQQFGITVNSQCILCSETNETRNHLFADCKMASSI